MSNFRVGQKVVCIAEGSAEYKALFPAAKWPVKGRVYTVRAINDWPHATLLRLDEIDNSHMAGTPLSEMEPGFNSKGFRPVVTRKTDISIFKAMLNPQKLRTDA